MAIDPVFWIYSLLIIILITMVVLLFKLMLRAIKALDIYIKKSSFVTS